MNMVPGLATWPVNDGGTESARLAEHPFLAAVVLFIGLSAANAVGGALQLGFFCVCLAVAILKQHRFPVQTLALVLLCGLLATLTTLRVDLSLAPLVRFLRPFIEGYLIAVVLYRVCNISSFESLMQALAYYVLLQFLSVVVLFALPDLRTALMNFLYDDESYQGAAFQFALLFRGFGISRHYLYGMPLAVGLIGAFLLVAAGTQKRWHLRLGLTVSAFCAMLVVIPNARIGLVPIILCYLLGISLFFRLYFLCHVAILVGVLIPVIIVLAPVYQGGALIDWLAAGFVQFVEPGEAADATTISVLRGMLILPTDAFSWVIGEGHVCQPGEDCYSDIGWIRLLQEGGLLLTTAVCVLYLHLILCFHQGLRCLDLHKPLRRLLFLISILTFVAATTKGDSFGANDYSRLLMTLAVLMHLQPRLWIRVSRTASTIPSLEAVNKRHDT